MSGKRYICRVIQAYGSMGPKGLVQHSVGDEVVRAREPVGSAHFELLRVEDEAPVFVVNPASEGEVAQAAAVAGSGDAITGDGTGEAPPELTVETAAKPQAAAARKTAKPQATG